MALGKQPHLEPGTPVADCTASRVGETLVFNPVKTPTSSSTWYLGLDWGTTGLSATFLHRETGSFHPIYLESNGSPCYRFAGKCHTNGNERLADSAQDRWLQEFKRLFAASLGGYSDTIWELQWQWSSEIAFSLEQIVAELTQWFGQWLATVQASGKAVGLDEADYQQAWSQLAGVVVGMPGGISDAYGFHLREVLLGAGLVEHPQQIFLVEDTVAILASQFPQGSATATPKVSPASTLSQRTAPLPSSGVTLVVHSGASATELALVSLPENYADLTHDRFYFRNFTYGGCALDQDTVLQVLLDGSYWESTELTIPPEARPKPGLPERCQRDRLTMALRSSHLGIMLLDIASDLKKVLLEPNNQDSYWLQIGNYCRQIQRRDLESRVLVPFVQQLNRELNALFSETGIAVQSVRHAICTGGNASYEAIGRWLRQKLPNATIVQDVYGEGKQATQTRIACGLAAVPLYPQLLPRGKAQYSDYFLLWELLDVLTRASLDRVPKSCLTQSQIFQWLQQRGIPVVAVGDRLERLLENRWPDGLFPDGEDELWLTPASRETLQQLQVRDLPLFERDREEGTYRLNLQVATLWRKYFHSAIKNSYQKLQEPLPAQIYSEVSEK
jgi:hypothetical protein